MRVLFFTLAIMLSMQTNVHSEEKKLPEKINHPNGIEFKLCSQQKITKGFFFNIVQVGLYYPSCPSEMKIFNRSNKLLRFHYLRKVTATQFKEGAIKYLTHNLTPNQYEKCFAKYKSLNNSYVDVKDGDYYDLYQIHPIGLDLYLNIKSLAQFSDEECEALYFNIWFGEESMSSGFKRLLDDY